MTLLALVFFVILVAIGGLGIDLGRVYGLHGQMVSYVDQVALASASELDGQTGAIGRAYRAAIGDASGGPLIDTTYNFADPGTTLGVYDLTFLSQLGPGPGPTPSGGDVIVCEYTNGVWAPTGCNDPTSANSADKTARFVAVTSVPLTVSYVVLPIADFFLGANGINDAASLKMQATAGYKQEACDLTPLMICNPDEPVGNTNTKYPYTPQIGQQILMKASSSSGSAYWAPGDFGLLQVPNTAGGSCQGSTHGASFITCVLALVNPLTQCVADSIQVKPGQSEVINNGINARFDIYGAAGGKFSGNALFAPSVNVTKGVCKITGSNCASGAGNACTNQLDPVPSSSPTVPLPRDQNLKADTTQTIRFGNGVSFADIQNYWATNHPGLAMPAEISTACQPGSGEPCRYTIYRYEVDHGIVPDAAAAGGEDGRPACTTPGVNNPDRDRRVFIMAVVNCQAAGLSGANNGQTLPVVAYVKMFLTEPVGLQEDATGKVTGFNAGSNANIYGEVVGVVKPGDLSGVIHVLPVLYR